MSIRERIEGSSGFDDRVLQLRSLRFQWERDVDSSKESLIKSGAFEIIEELFTLISKSDFSANYDEKDYSVTLRFIWDIQEHESGQQWKYIDFHAGADKFINLKCASLKYNEQTSQENIVINEVLDEEEWCDLVKFSKLVSIALVKAGIKAEDLLPSSEHSK